MSAVCLNMPNVNGTKVLMHKPTQVIRQGKANEGFRRRSELLAVNCSMTRGGMMRMGAAAATLPAMHAVTACAPAILLFPNTSP